MKVPSRPDLIVICDWYRVSRRFCLGALDLAVETLSPGTTSKDFINKSSLYERHGVKEYWIVDPGNRCVHLFTLQDGRYGGLAVNLKELFEDLWSM